MLDRTYHITPDLISDYVADRLDDDDARVVEEAIEHNDGIAAAVATARQVNSRMVSLRQQDIRFEIRGVS